MAKFKYEVAIPGSGKFLVESEGELSSEQAYRAASGQADMQRMADPTTGMSGLEERRAGFGKGISDLYRGVQQVAETQDFIVPSAAKFRSLFGQESKAPSLQQEEAESRKLDAPLMATTGGKRGNLLANLSVVLPSMFMPGANTYAGSTLIGTVLAAAQPTVNDQERRNNMAVGGALSFAGQGVGNAIGRFFRPVQSTLPPETAKLAAEAEKRGIPLTAGDLTGSRPLKVAESVMENLPFTAGPQLAQKQAQHSAFNRALLGTAGISDDVATAANLGSQKKALGSEFEAISARNSLDFNAPTFGQKSITDKLSDIAGTAERRLTPDKFTAVKNTVDDILSQVDNSGVMPGTNYQAWRGELRLLGKGDDYEASVYKGIKQTLDQAFSKQIPKADAAAWSEASKKYGNLKTLIDTAGSAGAATKVGNLPPASLEAALTRNIGREGKALGRGGDMNTLSAIGRTFVGDQIPNSGTAQRQLMQSLLTSGGTAGLGAGAALATGNDPLKWAAVGAGGLFAPRLVQMAMNSPAGQAYLTRGLLQLSPTQLSLINAVGRGGAMGLLGNASQ